MTGTGLNEKMANRVYVSAYRVDSSLELAKFRLIDVEIVSVNDLSRLDNAERIFLRHLCSAPGTV